MRALEQQQAQELLSAESLLSGSSSLQHLAASAPTTPPRVTAMLNGEISPLIGNSNLRSSTLDVDSLSKAVGTAVSDKRKSVTYASSVNRSPDLQAPSTGQAYGRGAKSMPASRRTSASEHDEELAGHLQGLSLIGERNHASPRPEQRSISRPVSGNFSAEQVFQYNHAVNAGMMLDEQLDMEMHSKCRPSPPRRVFLTTFEQMQSSTCQLPTMTSSLPHTLRSSPPLPQRWTLLLCPRTHVTVRSPPNGLSSHPLVVSTPFIVRTVASLLRPWAWRAIFRLLTNSTRPQ